MTDSVPTPAWIVTEGWAGILHYGVEIIGETPKKYRVRLLDESFLPPCNGTVRYRGDIFLVPKHAVRFGDKKW